MGKIADVQEVTLSKLIPYVNNAKIHSDDQVTKLASSIREFGFLNPVLIDKDFNIIAGHGRVMAAKKLEMDTIPAVFIEGLTDAQRKAYILADNRLSELSEWDTDLIAQELQALSDEGFDIDVTGFTMDDTILDLEPIDDNGVGDEIKEFLKNDPITERGDIWKLGDHTLMVGDSTSLDDVEHLLGGAKADLLETDPPYNVAVSNANGDTIANDDMPVEQFSEFLYNAFTCAYAVMRPGAVFYIWHADSNGLQFREACENAQLPIRQNLIWVKNHFTLGRQDYQWMHEPCLYGWKEGKGHYFSEKRNIPTIISSLDIESLSHEDLVQLLYDLREESTVMFEDRPMVDSLHPTMKPIQLIEKQIKNSSREGDNVLDLFGGSGTTLIACEHLNRHCYVMEYDPKYADVIIQRWEEETGQKAVKVEKP